MWKGFQGVRLTRQTLAEMEKPVIARVNGDCVGFGQSIMFGCDLIVAREHAVVADVHMDLQKIFGFDTVPGDGGGALVPLHMFPAKAMEYLLLAKPCTAAELARMGAINYAVPPEAATASPTPTSDQEPRLRAIVYTRPGTSDVLSLAERDVPEPGPGEVRVRLMRAGVNPTDWRFRVRPLSFDEVTPGQDGAGVVDAVGPQVADVAVGDRVWLILAQHQKPYGTAAEYVVQPTSHVVPLPDGVSFDVGASIGVPALTAHRALTVHDGGPSHLGPGAMAGLTVLVQGGAGAVGNAAVQLARWSGATVVTTVSSARKEALAKAAGAHHVVNYRQGDAESAIRAAAPDGVDVVVEVAPAQNNALDLAVLKTGGTVSIYAKHGGDEYSVPLLETYFKNLRYQYLVLYTLHAEALARATGDVTTAIATGGFRVGEDAGLPIHHFPLAEAAAAQDAVEQGAVGKVLLDVAEA